jgi:hypothetical protein
MSIDIKLAIRTVLAGAALSVVSSGAFAVGAVDVNYHPWVGNDNVVGTNETITASGLRGGMGVVFASHSWTDDSMMPNSANGHALEWKTFQVTAPNQIVTIKDQVTSGQSSRAFTVWASNGPFDGGTLSLLEVSSVQGYPLNAPHTFNAVGQMGSPGTLWMADPSVAIIDPAFSPAVSEGGGNMLSTLAYVNSGNAHTSSETSWGETINTGVNQVDTSGGYFSGVSGDYNAGMAELVFTNLSPGWYTVASGGANASLDATGMFHTLTVSTSAVPLPGAVYLFGSALAGLALSARRQKNLG